MISWILKEEAVDHAAENLLRKGQCTCHITGYMMMRLIDYGDVDSDYTREVLHSLVQEVLYDLEFLYIETFTNESGGGREAAVYVTARDVILDFGSGLQPALVLTGLVWMF
jgi:hypothetical protein